VAEAEKPKRPHQHVGLTEARRHLGELVTRVHLEETPVVLVKSGIPVAVILSLQEYRSLQETKNGDRRSE
jgi:prevent-host-death family protein